MDPLIVTIIFFGSLILLLMLGLPVAFTLGTLGVIGTLLIWPGGLYQIPATALRQVGNFVMVAVPLFILMAEVLMFSGLSDDLYDVTLKWLGRLPGGLASATIAASAVFASVSGTSTAGAATMGTVALPAMLERKYSKSLATGCVCAGGALGILIPPSIIMIIYGTVAEESVGQLFIGGIGPGLLLSALFIGYITIHCFRNKSLGPPGPSVSWKERFGSLWKLLPTLSLTVAILGSMYSGMATPTEASAVGAVGALAVAAGYRRLNWTNLKHAVMAATVTSCMILWIVVGAVSFVHFVQVAGISEFLGKVMLALPVGRWGIILIMQAIILLLGCFLDPVGILMIVSPVFVPVAHSLGFDGVWFGILFTINMEMAYLTPPFGFNLFIIRAIAPPEVTMGDVYRGIIPFVILDIIGLVLVMVFPQIALWLPSKMIGG